MGGGDRWGVIRFRYSRTTSSDTDHGLSANRAISKLRSLHYAINVSNLSQRRAESNFVDRIGAFLLPSRKSEFSSSVWSCLRFTEISLPSQSLPMPFIAKCDACRHPHRCRDSSDGKRIRCRACESTFVARMKVAETEASSTASGKVRRRRRAKVAETESPRETNRSISRFHLCLGTGALGILCVVSTIVMGRRVETIWRLGFMAIAALSFHFVYDQYCRHRIRTDVEHGGGTIEKISWRPFQGAFFTRGWTRSRSHRFFGVKYRDRDGRRQSGLCGVSLIWGTNWDWD